MKRFLWGVVLGALLTSVAAYCRSHAREQALQSEVEAANERAANWQAAYHKQGDYLEERARQVLDSQQLADSLEEANRALASDLERSQATVLSLQRSVSSLEAALDSTRSSVEQTEDSTYTVDLDEAVYLAGGGYLRVRGDVVVRIVEPPSVQTDLAVRGRFPLNIVLSELPEGDIRVDAFTGDPRLKVDSLRVTRKRQEPDGGGGLLAGIGDHFASGGSWLARGEGLLAGLLLCR